MQNWIEERENRLRDFFQIDANTELISRATVERFAVAPTVAENLQRHNIEWHVIPSANAVSIDTDDYRRRLYPMIKFDAANRDYQTTGSYRAIMNGHARHQGRIIGIETTMKPKYLPDNRQFYGTNYGFNPKSDPFSYYFGRAGFMSSAHAIRTITALYVTSSI